MPARKSVLPRLRTDPEADRQRFWDPMALAVGALSLGTCAFFAAIIPATRATAISPIRALRTE